jgi:hypothetical protein
MAHGACMGHVNFNNFKCIKLKDRRDRDRRADESLSRSGPLLLAGFYYPGFFIFFK